VRDYKTGLRLSVSVSCRICWHC